MNEARTNRQPRTSSARCLARTLLAMVTGWLALAGGNLAFADPVTVATTAAAPADTTAIRSIRAEKSYALGIANYYLDHDTKVTGWRVGERWFFGRQRGMDSGLTLVWQLQANQLSLSKDGVRFTRRF